MAKPATFVVTLNTDPVPGGGMHSDNIYDTMHRLLNDRIAHYNPRVVTMDEFNSMDEEQVDAFMGHP